MKRIILKKIREFGQDVFITEEQLTKALGELKNTHVFLLKPHSINREVGPPILAGMIETKLDGIRSFHYFRLRKEGSQYLDCFHLSASLQPEKSILLPTELEINQERSQNEQIQSPLPILLLPVPVQDESFSSHFEEDDDDYFDIPQHNDDDDFLPPRVTPLEDTVPSAFVPFETLEQNEDEHSFAVLNSSSRRQTTNPSRFFDYVLFN